MPAVRSGECVSASTVIHAPPEVIFRIVADPYQHARIDGSGSVRHATSGPRQLALGDRFGTHMRIGVPYRMRNEVVEFEQDRLIAWRTLGPHRWRYELDPGADGSTTVTETWDPTRYAPPMKWFFRAIGFPERNRRGIEATLFKLKAAAEADAAAG